MNSLSFSRALVVGLGRSGLAAARLAAADGADVVVTDRRAEPELTSAVAGLPSGTEVFLGGHPGDCLDGIDLVILSPGVAPASELPEMARTCGIPVMTEVEFAWRHRPEAPMAAITGSNGKSTVTTLVAEMLASADIKVVAGGNLGTAASELVLAGGWDQWVLEISSFQSELFSAVAPTVAVFLNLSQDHLERHDDIEDYLAAKRRLFAFQNGDDTAVLNADDPASAATETKAVKRFFSLEQDADARFGKGRLFMDGTELLTADEVRISGDHNIANVLAAGLAAVAMGAPRTAVVSAAQSFDGLAHRHRVVHEAAGVRWVDDSKATNIGATLAALRGYPASSLHLILGGQGKGQNFSVLADEVRRSVACLYLIGVDGPVIGDALGNVAPLERCSTLTEAVARARAGAEAGQTVLLAPACASFDQFKNYEQRGDVFAALAREEVAVCP